jgi:hypothetical protein
MARALAFGRLVIAWGTLAAFILFGEAWLADLASMVKSTDLLFWLFVVMLWLCLWCCRAGGPFFRVDP